MAKDVVPEERRRRRRPTRQGTVLSERLIVETALRMVREHGSAGLSARRLGAALGADPSTLYRYFDGMDGLTLAIGEELIGRALMRLGPDRAVARGPALTRAAHPRGVPRAPAGRAADREPGDRQAARDRRRRGDPRQPAGAGFGDVDAVRIYHAYIDQCLAFAALDAGALALSEEARDSDEERWESTYARLLKRGSTRTSRRRPGCWPRACRTVPIRSRWRCCWMPPSGNWAGGERRG